jgi:hypothetical protein
MTQKQQTVNIIVVCKHDVLEVGDYTSSVFQHMSAFPMLPSQMRFTSSSEHAT